MIFQNFKAFDNVDISLAKTGISDFLIFFSFLNYNSLVVMSTGEINYDDLMHNDNTTTYYKVSYILLVLFAIAMVVLATNLLIGTNDVDFVYLCIFLDVLRVHQKFLER